MMERDEIALFEHSIESVADAAVDDGTFDTALVDLGWDDALAADTRVAVEALFTVQGRHAITSTRLSAVILHGLGTAARTGPATVALPLIGEASTALENSGVLHVSGLVVGPVTDTAEVLAVAGPIGRGSIAWRVPANRLVRRTVEGVDPDLGLVEISGRLDTASITELGPVDWSDGVRLGRLAIGHELAGAAATMIDLARAHALDRIQFGQPIARFQAIRHRLAEAFVALEATRAALDGAWLDGTAVTASMAKALAGRNAKTVAKHCQQVLAGIGFTTEHDLHRYVRRVLVLDNVLGSSSTLTAELGHDLVAARRIPPLLSL